MLFPNLSDVHKLVLVTFILFFVSHLRSKHFCEFSVIPSLLSSPGPQGSEHSWNLLESRVLPFDTAHSLGTTFAFQRIA